MPMMKRTTDDMILGYLELTWSSGVTLARRFRVQEEAMARGNDEKDDYDYYKFSCFGLSWGMVPPEEDKSRTRRWRVQMTN